MVEKWGKLKVDQLLAEFFPIPKRRRRKKLAPAEPRPPALWERTLALWPSRRGPRFDVRKKNGVDGYLSLDDPQNGRRPFGVLETMLGARQKKTAPEKTRTYLVCIAWLCVP